MPTRPERSKSREALLTAKIAGAAVDYNNGSSRTTPQLSNSRMPALVANKIGRMMLWVLAVVGAMTVIQTVFSFPSLSDAISLSTAGVVICRNIQVNNYEASNNNTNIGAVVAGTASEDGVVQKETADEEVLGSIYELTADYEESFPLPTSFDHEENAKLCEFRRQGVPVPSNLNQEEIIIGGPNNQKDPARRTLPRPEFKDKIKYVTLGGSNYLLQLDIFINSMLRFNIARQDILILSLDEITTQHLLKRGVMAAPYYSDRILDTECGLAQNVTNIRCQVSLGKCHIFEQVLEDGYGIFLTDADVFFYQHPYLSMRVHNPNLDLYVQADMFSPPSDFNPMGPSNFGVLLAFPSMLNRQMMHHIYRNVMQIADQWSFNNWLGGMRGGLRLPNMTGICQGELDYEQIKHDMFFNAMLTSGPTYTTTAKDDNAAPPQITLFHSTCAEGSHTKEFLAQCMFPWNDPQYYNQGKKTVTTNKPLDPYNIGEIDYTLRTLARIAKATGRSVRLNMRSNQTNIYDPTAPWSIINGEAFRKAGIDLVEPDYWINAKRILGSDTSSVSYTQSDSVVFREEQIVYWKLYENDNTTSFEELVIELDPVVLDQVRQTDIRLLQLLSSDYTCRSVVYNRARGCLHLCNGNHF